MRTVLIQEFLKEHGISVEDIELGFFDSIGEFTAKKSREPNHPLYKSVGCFFRPNYERGILVHSLIKKYGLTSVCEIGFGRGYTALCAAAALCETSKDGKVITVDPTLDENHMKMIAQIFPKEWLDRITFVKGPSPQAFSHIEGKFDLVYVDGDHRAEAVRADWEVVKDRWNAFCLFDDYHLPTKNEKDIECAKVIDEIQDPTKTLIKLDRRIFVDDRKWTDEQVDYGQVMLTNNDYLKSLMEW